MLRIRLVPGALLGLVWGCGGTPTEPPPPPPPSCTGVVPLQLSPGQHQIIDPAAVGACIRVPDAGATGAEYLLVLASTSPLRTATGVQGAFALTTAAGSAPAPPGFAAPPTFRTLTPAEAFHARLRELEAAWTAARPADPTLAPPPPPPIGPAAAPPVGDRRTFKVCATLQCGSFTDVTAVARWVGQHAAIYMDEDVPQADPLQDSDFENLGTAFDTRHYPIDTTAFGRESDIDNNGVVLVLMTDAINALTPDCTSGRIAGYFLGLDLDLNFANSNRAEVFYTLVPAPATPTCNAVSRLAVVNNVKPTLLHELQHMIGWNQHVIMRGGPVEQTWLNEALSHFAEELGGRLIPDGECPGFPSCRSQYSSGNIINAYDYLKDTEAFFLINPTSSTGTLEERGAGWHFLRWVLDHFSGADSLQATAMSRALVQTNRVGADNVQAVAGESLATMVVQWLLASYLDDRPGISDASGRLRFKSWGLRAIWLNPANGSVFHETFPLRPDSTSSSYSRTGTLRGGSGRHLRIIQAADGQGVTIRTLRNLQGQALDPGLQARVGIVRIR